MVIHYIALFSHTIMEALAETRTPKQNIAAVTFCKNMAVQKELCFI